MDLTVSESDGEHTSEAESDLNLPDIDEDEVGSSSPHPRGKTLGPRRRAVSGAKRKKPSKSARSGKSAAGGGKSVNRARNYCFTIHHNAAAVYKELKECDLPEEIQFIVFQGEECPTTKRKHLQGYVQLTKQLGFVRVKEIFGCDTMHLEAAKGTAEDNIKYCTKEETRWLPPVQRGECKKQGKRTDLEAVATAIRGGAKLKDLAENNPKEFMLYHKGMLAYKRVVKPPLPRNEPEVYFLYGSPGCGKSRLVLELLKNDMLEGNVYFADDVKERWFDGYDGQNIVVFDDFEGNFPIRSILRLLDRVPLQLPFKGGFCTIEATKFFFTSNHPPETFYNEVSHDAWMRRITEFAAEHDRVWGEEEVALRLAAGMCSEVAASITGHL